MRERDHSRHLAVGAGAPSDPDGSEGPPVAADTAAPDDPVAVPDPAGPPDPPFDAGPFADPPAIPNPPAPGVEPTPADLPDQPAPSVDAAPVHADPTGAPRPAAVDVAPVPGSAMDAADVPDLRPRLAADVVQAVADFIDDLVDDPTFGDDPHHTRCTSGAHVLDLDLDDA